MPDPDPQTPPIDPAGSPGPVAVPAAPSNQDPPTLADPMDTDAGRRALAAERQRATDEKRRADDLDARLKAIEDKDKTDLERATARVAELEQSYASEQQQRLRLQVATQHGIPAADLVLLTGTSEEQLTAQAERIAALNAASAAAQAAPTFAPNPGQHAGNGTPVTPKASVSSGRDMFRGRHPGKSGA